MTAARSPVRLMLLASGVVTLNLVAADVRADTPGDGPHETLLANSEAWPSPVADHMLHAFLLADLLEYHGADNGPVIEWDLLGWAGGDIHRLWIKSEGGQFKPLNQGGDGDLQLLYGRLISPFFDLQAGLRWEVSWARRNRLGRVQGAFGLQGLIPYEVDLQVELFVTPAFQVSGRVTLAKEFWLTQRAVLQLRLETSAAVQRVEEFGIGAGLNDLSVGLRLRYELAREFAPYLGAEWRRLFFGAADLARADGLDPNLLTWVVGVRAWY